MRKESYKKLLLLFILIIICFSQMVFADTIVSQTVTISARVVVDNGGGNTGGGGIDIPTTVNFSGWAYPYSTVYLLKDGFLEATVVADQSAYFTFSISDLVTDTYTFSIYTEDDNGRKSSLFSFPILINSGTAVNIDNIFLSPTIDTDKTEVKKGDLLKIFGQSIPLKEVLISINLGQDYVFSVVSDSLGKYLYNLDTSNLNLGRYKTKSKTIYNNKESLYAIPVSFLVGEDNINGGGDTCNTLPGDLNCDNHVNLTDFSIMAYWYNKFNPPETVDLNGDGTISLVDFSIMAFYWTE